jgi:hypothetical protein
MQRSELEHLIRASGEIADDDEIIVIGSQAILGQFPNAPVRLLMSMEADIYPKNNPDKADKVDGALARVHHFTSYTATMRKALEKRRQYCRKTGKPV